MARPLRIAVPDGVYHVGTRGNGRQRIYRDDLDRARFLELAGDVLTRYRWRCLAYCLVGNHYHLLIQTPVPNLSRGMRPLNGIYAQRFNRRHGRVGHLFGGRFKATLVQEDRHLLEAARYIALNPVRAGLCARPEQWRWGAHRALIGNARDPLVETSLLLAHFGSDEAAARHRYARFVAADSGDDMPRGQVAFGDPEFVAASLPRPSESDSEHPKQQFRRNPLPLEEILADPDRDRAIASAYVEHGYRLREIAATLGCHYSTVSRRLRAHERQRDLDAGSHASCKT